MSQDGSPAWAGEALVGTVVIATPCYGGAVTVGYLRSLLATVSELSRLGIRTSLLATGGDSLVQRARNTLAAEFLATEGATHLLWIDADIDWRAEDVVRLLCHDVDVVGGLYPKKTLPLEFVFHPADDGGGLVPTHPKTGALECASIGTGFLLVKRRVFVDLAESGTVEKITRGQPVAPAVEPWLYNFHPVTVIDGVLLSEDYGFCERWRALGGKVWADPSIVLGHTGPSRFSGSPMDHLPTRLA